MVPRLEALEDRFLPDAAPIDPGLLLAQMQAFQAAAQSAANAINALFPTPQPTLLGNIQGLILTSQLESLVTVQLATFFQDLGPILLAASTLGPRG